MTNDEPNKQKTIQLLNFYFIHLITKQLIMEMLSFIINNDFSIALY